MSTEIARRETSSTAETKSEHDRARTRLPEGLPIKFFARSIAHVALSPLAPLPLAARREALWVPGGKRGTDRG